jgi:hypothetical protein
MSEEEKKVELTKGEVNKKMPIESNLPDHVEKVMDKPKKRAGRPKGAKKKDSIPSKDDPITLLIDEVKGLKDQLEETKKQLDDQKKQPVAVRLENRKKKFSAPAYSGPMKRVKFMRNDQPENPMNVCLKKVVFNVEKDCKEMIDYEKTLIPGQAYELPEPVMEFLNTRTVPTYGERADPENPRQTVTMQIGEQQRCYCVPA